jgi:antitoxin ParD1/3/4
MASVNVRLTDELQEFVDGQVETGHFDDASEYIEALIARAKEGKEKLELLLIEGLDSGNAIPLDEAEWDRIRNDVTERLSSGQ